MIHSYSFFNSFSNSLPRPSEYTQPGAPSRKSVKDAVQMVENSVLAIHGSIKQDYEDLVALRRESLSRL